MVPCQTELTSTAVWWAWCTLGHSCARSTNERGLEKAPSLSDTSVLLPAPRRLGTQNRLSTNKKLSRDTVKGEIMMVLLILVESISFYSTPFNHPALRHMKLHYIGLHYISLCYTTD